MRIPCFFKPGIYEAAYIVAILKSDTPRIYETIEFLVDTGASRTTICDKDAVRLRADYRKLEKHGEGMLGIGGVVNAYILRDVDLIFRTENGKSFSEKLGRIYILRHDVPDEKIMRIPSILGRDILNKYALFYDKRNEKAYITNEILT